MNIQRSVTSFLFFLTSCKSIEQGSSRPPHMSLVQFQSLLYSEINSEIEVFQQQDTPHDPTTSHNDHRLRGRFLREEDVITKAQQIWENVVKHGWDMSQVSHKSYQKEQSVRKLQEEQQISDQSPMISPYLVCSHTSEDKSGYQRLQAMLEFTGAHLGDYTLVRNDPDKTCYHISLEYKAARKVVKSMESGTNSIDGGNDYYTLVPLTDLMKIQLDTMTMISEDSWTIPTKSTADDWERMLRVGLSTGHRVNLSEERVLDTANNIIDDIQSLGQVGAQNRRRLQLQNDNKQDKDTPVSALSDLFSLTSSNNKAPPGQGNRYLRKSRGKVSIYNSPHWNRALELGLEADHSCETMFKMLHVNVHYDNEGFDIVLNGNGRIEGMNDSGKKEHNDDIEFDLSSASNKHCVASLIMALSTHPQVLSVESEGPIVADDYEAQWITQSKVEGKRPLRDIGIDGTNQIISIIDSGLDIHHKYFGPSDEKIFHEWDHSQRKVVRYDHSIGDKIEPRGGHGTKVAGAAAGNLDSDGDSIANGVAEGAKLHIFDIQQGSGGYKMPSANTFFNSMHSTDKTPARVANGSWNTKYRAYPFSCKFFDENLHGEFKGDLYIASAGNEGLNESTMESRERTIGNPASCKNTLAVGASQSHGNRLTAGDKGMDYLAAFSSRGPTFDGRMKPDIVAPGASILTAYAQETDKTVQDYGTSVSSPVVAGNAALVRQYFEEGKLPCNWNNCAFDPSGSLVKAVLLNSAYSLKQVQVSRPWLKKNVLEEVGEYDSNQGLGLVQLDQTLPIAGHNKFNAIIRNNKEIKDKEIQDIFIRATPFKCMNTSYKHQLSATLTWYDPAGATSCAKCLVNDLDIMVHAITTNGKVKPGSKVFPNGATHKDFDNNVERIRFNMQGTGRYRIRVNAANLAVDKTQFSLIATGCFKVIANPASS